MVPPRRAARKPLAAGCRLYLCNTLVLPTWLARRSRGTLERGSLLCSPENANDPRRPQPKVMP